MSLLKRILRSTLSENSQHNLIRLKLSLTGDRVKKASLFVVATKDKRGLEIGGPSGIFQDHGILPIYRNLGQLDNCVFAHTTIWEGQRGEGRTFKYHSGRPPGNNFIREATDLHGIENSSYDFVLSSHNL